MFLPPDRKSAVPIVVKQDGVTASEQYLSALCDRTFLSLWSFPAIYRDQRSSPNSDGKEVCDLLVVFGNDVIIFSDKACEFPSDPDLDRAWSRWFRRAVLQSAKQLWGVERWILDHRDRLFLDRKCAQKLPLSLPAPELMKIHRVVVAHDSVRRCQEVLGGSGSLMLCSLIRGQFHYDVSTEAEWSEELKRIRSAFHSASGTNTRLLPLTVGDVEPNRGFIHVFDDVALCIVMDVCDTAADFVAYLTKRETFLRSCLVHAAGEEDLLAIYLQLLDSHEQNCLPEPQDDNQLIIIPEGEWWELVKSKEWKHRERINRDSYGWDRIIEDFNKHILQGTAEAYPEHSFDSQERAVRALARESRNQRRVLALTLSDFLETPYRSDIAARVVAPDSRDGPYYLFLTLKRNKGKNLEEYRKLRRALMLAYARIFKVQFPDARQVVVVSTEPNWQNGNSSRDLLYYDLTQFTEKELDEARAMQAKVGLLTKLQGKWRSAECVGKDGKRSVKRPASRRNSMCPCGSGSKYKYCCMRTNLSAG